MVARQRFIHPGIWCDPSFGALSDMSQLTFIGLFSNADDDGRILAGAAYIKSVVWPHRDMSLAKVKNARDEMLKALPRVMLYEVANVEYITFLKWSDYQKPKYPSPSKLPAPPEKDSGTVPERVEESSVTPPPPVPPRARADLGLGLGKGLGEEAKASSAPPPAPPKIDHHWEAAALVYGKVTNRRERDSRNSALPHLRESLDGTPVENYVDEMKWRKEVFEWTWQKPCSLHALVKHWSEAEQLRDFAPRAAAHPKSRGESISDRVAASRAATYEMLGLTMNGQNGQLEHDLELDALEAHDG